MDRAVGNPTAHPPIQPELKMKEIIYTLFIAQPREYFDVMIKGTNKCVGLLFLVNILMDVENHSPVLDIFYNFDDEWSFKELWPSEWFEKFSRYDPNDQLLNQRYIALTEE